MMNNVILLDSFLKGVMQTEHSHYRQELTVTVQRSTIFVCVPLIDNTW
jgi:hypothetical protein